MGGFEFVEQQDQAEFNAGIAKLYRLDAIKRLLDNANATNDYDLQFRCCKAYYKELVTVMKTEDDEKQKKMFIETRNVYMRFRQLVRIGKKSVPIDIIDAFDRWEIDLRNIEQKYGLEMPKKQDARWAMAGRDRK